MALSHASEIARHYQTLGLEYGADPAAIKKAYHRLALQWHPDKQGCSSEERSHATSMFQAVQRSYEALTTECNHGYTSYASSYRRTMAEAQERFEQLKREKEKER